VACYWYNNTAFNNKGANFFMQGITYNGGSDYVKTNRGILRNNIAFTGTAITFGDGPGVDASSNTWDLSGIRVTAEDFRSTDTTGVFGPRKADGSLPDVQFLKLAAGSDLIDKGENVGLPFYGVAPDLGAFEYQDPAIIIAAPYQKTMQLSKGLPETGNCTNQGIYDLSGRRIPPGRGDKTYRIFIHDRRTPEGSHCAWTSLHTR
ncbi:MAG: DUF4990 domain-containing protein, partial [Chitinispirillaceae bacterium]|nr:DUF4990 domain-containing protein [Chitinispirillaceae bacterium]